MKVLICGSRKWGDRDAIEKRVRLLLLSLAPGEKLFLITGGARGADRLVEDVADQLHVDCKVMRADWSVKEDTPPWAIRTTRDGRRYDLRAGHERNTTMLDEEPELVIGFADDLDDAPGTADCLRQAKARKITTELWNRDGMERSSGAHPALF